MFYVYSHLWFRMPCNTDLLGYFCVVWFREKPLLYLLYCSYNVPWFNFGGLIYRSLERLLQWNLLIPVKSPGESLLAVGGQEMRNIRVWEHFWPSQNVLFKCSSNLNICLYILYMVEFDGYNKSAWLKSSIFSCQDDKNEMNWYWLTKYNVTLCISCITCHMHTFYIVI